MGSHQKSGKSTLGDRKKLSHLVMKFSKIVAFSAISIASAQKNSKNDDSDDSFINLFNVPVDQGQMLQTLKSFNSNIASKRISYHGCHCARYSRSENLGGSPVDALDESCLEWNKKMKCITLEKGACSDGISITSYPIQLKLNGDLSDDAEFACQYAGDKCAKAICLINYEVGLALWESVSKKGPGHVKWPEYELNASCTPNRPSYAERVCQGDAPDVYIVNKAEKKEEKKEIRQEKKESKGDIKEEKKELKTELKEQKAEELKGAETKEEKKEIKNDIKNIKYDIKNNIKEKLEAVKEKVAQAKEDLKNKKN